MTSTRRADRRLLVSVQLEQDISEAEAITRTLSERNWQIVLVLEQSLLGLAREDLVSLVDHASEVHVNVQGYLHSWLSELILSCDGALLITETSHPYHRLNHILCHEANRVGVTTITVQHGLENIGLTQSDDQNPIDKVSFASQHVLTWVKEQFFHPDIAPETRAKTQHVGLVPVPAHPLQGYSPEVSTPLPIGIFESLHRARYSEDRRAGLLSLIERAVRLCPDLRFLCLSHPIGRWMEQHRPVRASNLSYYEVNDRLHGSSSRERTIDSLTAAVVTPSSVVVDLAVRKMPYVLLGDLEGHECLLYQGFFRAEDDTQLKGAIQILIDPRRANEVVEQHRAFLCELCGHLDGVRGVADFLETVIAPRRSVREVPGIRKEEFLSTEAEVRAHGVGPAQSQGVLGGHLPRALRIAIYGTGFAGRRLCHALPPRIQVNAFLDPQAEASARKIDGIVVIRPSREFLRSLDYIFVAARSADAVRGELQEHGMPAERIVCFNATQ